MLTSKRLELLLCIFELNFSIELKFSVSFQIVCLLFSKWSVSFLLELMTLYSQSNRDITVETSTHFIDEVSTNEGRLKTYDVPST